jgi:RNA polymerase sigma factor (sigma-70 family)
LELNIPSLFPARTRFDEAEFNRLFLDFYPRICAVGFRLVGDRDLAEDLAAEAFWKLWSAPPADQEKVRAWLYRVVTNLGYNLLRASKRRAMYEQNTRYLLADPQVDDDPQDKTAKREDIQRVRDILRKMPRRDVQLLILRHSGLSYKEIAEALSIIPASIGTLLNRAEKKFAFLYSQGEDHASQG